MRKLQKKTARKALRKIIKKVVKKQRRFRQSSKVIISLLSSYINL